MFEVSYRPLSIKLENYISGKKPQSRLPGIRSLSKEFQVNPKTVSKALRLLEDRNLVEITQQGVFIATPRIADFDYVHVFYASYHRDICNDCWSYEIQEELSRVLASKQCSLSVSYLSNGQTVKNFITQHGVTQGMKNGVFFLNYKPTDEDIKMLRLFEIPVVLLGERSGKEDIASCGDCSLSQVQVNLEHLIENGHTDIAMILDLKNKYNDIYFKDVVQGILTDHNLKMNEDLCVHALQWNFDEGCDAASQLISRKQDYTAILCMGDQVTLATARCCFENRLRVPEDISLVGSAMNWLNKVLPVRPTGYQSDVQGLVHNMIEILDAQRNHGSLSINRKIPARFVAGQSCRCIR